jgi:hypothetical protein
MAANFAKQVRKEQTQLELKRLKDELAEWLKHRDDEDEFHQYQTQLGAIGTLISGTAEQLEVALMLASCRTAGTQTNGGTRHASISVCMKYVVSLAIPLNAFC